MVQELKLGEIGGNMVEDTLILGYGTGCGRGAPPRLKMAVNDGKVAPVLYEEDSGCDRRGTLMRRY